MYERITMTWWDRFFGRPRILDHFEYMELSERKQRKFVKCAPIPDQHKRPVANLYDYPNSCIPPIIPDYSSFNTSSYDSGGGSSSDSDSGFSDFGGGDGGGGGASSDY